jgi:hypothetical protein
MAKTYGAVYGKNLWCSVWQKLMVHTVLDSNTGAQRPAPWKIQHLIVDRMFESWHGQHYSNHDQENVVRRWPPRLYWQEMFSWDGLWDIELNVATIGDGPEYEYLNHQHRPTHRPNPNRTVTIRFTEWDKWYTVDGRPHPIPHIDIHRANTPDGPHGAPRTVRVV